MVKERLESQEMQSGSLVQPLYPCLVLLTDLRVGPAPLARPHGKRFPTNSSSDQLTAGVAE
jgi:hypothetical protein